MILICGEALIDMVRIAAPGGGEAFLPLPGGSPFNTAVAVGRLGVGIQFMGRLSKDLFGEMLLERLRENNIRSDFLVLSDQKTTLAFVKLEKGREPQYSFYTADTADRSFSMEDLRAVMPENRVPPEIHGIIFGSIAMTMEPAASTIESFVLREGARTDSGAPVISFDPNIRPFMIQDRAAYVKRFEKWIGASTIAKISEADFDFIYPGLGLEKSMERVLAAGVRLGAATLGPEGALALLRRNDGGILKARAPVVDLPVADTIGAGDTFHGAFLSWFEIRGKLSRRSLGELSEEELREALFFANKAASIVCSRQGAEPPTLREVEDL
ncbi:MAG: carbohydrate kinase [Treponema sp.]|jgi:fructokinase|nr:carbohydrate kinase [Treponema sp.]